MEPTPFDCSLGYDGNFNLNYWGGATVTYDAQNKMTSIDNGNAAQFAYDGLSRCVKRTINGVTNYFVYDGWKPVIEMDGGVQNLLAYNVYGPGEGKRGQSLTS